MSIVSNTALAFSMSADAFAAAVSKGTVLRHPPLTQAMRIGLIFGVVETVTPLLGWLVGLAFSRYIAEVDHWVAFVLLGAIGVKMIYEGLFHRDEEKPTSHKLSILLLTALGTSIDAMAVGVTLAFLDANIVLMALMIGAATFLMATIGIMAGHWLGKRAGSAAEVMAGLCLIAIGSNILCEHLRIFWHA